MEIRAAEPVENRAISPYNANGRLVFKENGADAYGSAVLIRPSVAITAAHCLHSGRGGTYHTEVAFFPQHPVSEFGIPRGFAAARRIVASGWMSGDDDPFCYDFGFIKFDADVTFHYGPAVPLMWNAVYEQVRTSVGYPWEPNPPYNGRRMWAATGSYTPDPLDSPCFIGMNDNDMKEGASGGGFHIFDAGAWYTNGVMSFYYDEHPDKAFSNYFSQRVNDLLVAFDGP